MRILITGDFYRPVSDIDMTQHQRHNIDWLFNSLYKHLNPNYVFKTNTRSDEFVLPLQEWIEFDSIRDFSPIHLNILNPFMTSKFYYEMIIGFELPEPVKLFLRDYNIPFVDIVLHWCRFHTEPIYGVDSNIYGFDKVINKYKHKIERPVDPNYTRTLNLIIGQTPIDRSLICNGRMLSLQDFNFDDLNYTNFLYIPHPLSPNHEVEFFEKKNIPTIIGNTYSFR
jgi:hypothetical protein